MAEQQADTETMNLPTNMEDTPVQIRVCDLCQSVGNTSPLPCYHRFCQQCLEQLQATEQEGEPTCVVCSSYAPLPQNGGLEDKERQCQSTLQKFTADVVNEIHPTTQQAEHSGSSEQSISPLNSVEEELLSESEAPNVHESEVVNVGKPTKEQQPGDLEYFLCLNNNNAAHLVKDTKEDMFLSGPQESTAAEYEKTGKSDDTIRFQELIRSELMSRSKKWRRKSSSGSPSPDASRRTAAVKATTTATATTTAETATTTEEVSATISAAETAKTNGAAVENATTNGTAVETAKTAATAAETAATAAETTKTIVETAETTEKETATTSKETVTTAEEKITAETTNTSTADQVQQEPPRRSQRLNSEDRKYILVSKKAPKDEKTEDSKLQLKLDIATPTATCVPIGQAEMVERQQNGEQDKKESPLDNDTGKDSKEASPQHKRGLCKCSRGEVKSVHCSVCQKYVCIHCATHEHKDHSDEEIREALDKEKDKIQHGLDIAKTCADAHKKRMEELEEAEQNLLKQFENMSIKIADHSDIALSLINERIESIVQAVQQEAEKARESVRDFKAESLEGLMTAFEERRFKISEERETAQVAFAASSSYSNISRKILDDGSSAVVLTSSNSLSEVFKTLKYPCEKTSAPNAIPSEFDRRLWFMAPEVDISGEVQKWFGKVINNSSKEVVPGETRRPSKSSTAPKQGPTLIATLKSATTQLHRTFSVAADEENDIIVAGQNIVRIFNSDTLRLKSAVALAFNPEGLAAYGDEIFVTGNGHNIHVLKKNGDSRRVLRVEGVLSRLQGLAVDRNGRIIATEGRQVFVLLSDGTDVCTFDVATEGGPVRLYPATNSSDRIIISDQSGHTIKLYDASGNLIRQMGGKGKDDGQLLGPAEVCTDEEDNIIVADTKNNRVSQFKPDGTFDRHLVVEENYVRFPWGVALTGDGRLVVSSLAVGQAVKVFDLHINS
ncbi:E3 ubiquitin-protein ligase TRIM71-like [Branchiostoma floridae]|uniref:RING-type E3 ubiquitin transferase n=1 Tax=Branchiostoma floridae TaxID=7739 RepID=A0A9J7MEP0_BRAFL|nr:E3 ubiquitin-protein ligase TRIM71-like [Branchiostoma floridae]